MSEAGDIWMEGARRELWRAGVLHDAEDAPGAYFHSGQAVEFGLKAILLRRHNLSEMPTQYRGAGWHDLQHIAQAARLTPDVVAQSKLSRAFEKNWILVRSWSSNARFPGQKLSVRVYEAFYPAVSDRNDGVMPWLKKLYPNA